MAAWSSPGYEAIAHLARERAGLVFPPARRPAVEDAVRRLMARRGIRDLAHVAGLLGGEGAACDELLADLTVGETYFFREPAHFAFIEREVVPALLRRRGAARVIRAWSAGCASGEEPYSLALLFEQMGLLARGRVLGTDLSRPRLEAARRARYPRWSFRGVPGELIDTYFTRRGDHFELERRIRGAVEFRWLNLAGENYPAQAAGIGEMDLILCRNVLIYFDADTVAAVAHRLLASLSEDGWLFLGASDPPLTDLVPCTVVQTGNGVAYRRAGHVAPRRKAPPPPPEVAPPRFVEPAPALPDELQADVPDILPPPSAIRGEAVHAPGEREGERGDDERWALRVRALADEGRLEEAGRLCAGGLDRHRLSGELAILHSLLLAEAGRAGEAAAAARRALYLDRGLVMAHLAQARALARLDDQAGARRSLENARRLLAALPADAIVPASGGERAGHLIGAVRVQLRLYGGAS